MALSKEAVDHFALVKDAPRVGHHLQKLAQRIVSGMPLDADEARSAVRLLAAADRLVAIVEKCHKGDAEDGKHVCLYSHEGDLLGRHKDKQDAYVQEYAIEKSEERAGK